MEEVKYTKLKDLVGSEFTIEQVYGYSFKKWDAEAKRMLMEDSWNETMRGDNQWRKVYGLKTDKGKLDLSENQLGTIMVKSQHAGKADVNGLTIAVKSNGKEGIDIRYYLNPTKQKKVETKQDEVHDVSDEPIDMSSIPFN